MEDNLLIGCFIKKDENGTWLYLKYNPLNQVVGDSYLIDYFSKEELLEKTYKAIKEQINLWYLK